MYVCRCGITKCSSIIFHLNQVFPGKFQGQHYYRKKFHCHFLCHCIIVHSHIISFEYFVENIQWFVPAAVHLRQQNMSWLKQSKGRRTSRESVARCWALSITISEIFSAASSEQLKKTSALMIGAFKWHFPPCKAIMANERNQEEEREERKN